MITNAQQQNQKQLHSGRAVKAAYLFNIARAITIAIGLLNLFGFAACSEERKPAMGIDFADMVDLQPPKLEGVHVRSADSIELCFNEEVIVAQESLHVSDPLVLARHDQSECGVMLSLATDMMPGVRYTVSMTVMDQNGNSLDIITNVYGHNDNIPRVVINEFTTRGSKRNPDIVELYLHSKGNIGGLTLYEGTPASWESRKILPALDLPAGSYILVHFKPEGTAEAGEVDETTDPNSSAGINAHESAWDFWVADGNGIGGNNGALTLTAAPDGAMLDAVVYTNRTSASDTKYRGFGSAQHLARAEELRNADQWEAAEADIRPEDAVFIDYSTATRSIGRNSASADSNSNADWRIVPTSGYSFGSANSDEVYER